MFMYFRGGKCNRGKSSAPGQNWKEILIWMWKINLYPMGFNFRRKHGSFENTRRRKNGIAVCWFLLKFLAQRWAAWIQMRKHSSWEGDRQWKANLHSHFCQQNRRSARRNNCKRAHAEISFRAAKRESESESGCWEAQKRSKIHAPPAEKEYKMRVSQSAGQKLYSFYWKRALSRTHSLSCNLNAFFLHKSDGH